MAEHGAWWPPVAVGACLAAELALASASFEPEPVLRPYVITAIIGLAMLAIGISAWWSLPLRREAGGPRFIAAVPILLAVGATVVLSLEAHGHAGWRLAPRGPAPMTAASQGAMTKAR